jgi:hypothetical protein
MVRVHAGTARRETRRPAVYYCEYDNGRDTNTTRGSACHRIRPPPVDTLAGPPNNSVVPRPEVARRVKSYSAATGVVYQYYFFEVQKSKRGPAAGTEFTYMVSVDRKTAFPLRIFVRADALEQWGRQNGRSLTGTEEYAVAKMRLFQALDDVEDLATARPELPVDASNLESLLTALGI